MIKTIKKKNFLLFLLALTFSFSFIAISVKAETDALMSKGKASWYAHKGGLFAASPDYPMGTKLKVTSVTNPTKSVIVTVNDFGPDRSIHPDRVIDLDKIAFEKLAPLGAGVIEVSVVPTEAILPTNTPNYTNGELWQNTKTGGVYWVTKDGKQPLTDRVFLNTIFKGKKIIPKAPLAFEKLKVLAPVAFFDGYLLKGTTSPGVYLISKGERRAFVSGTVFEKKGYAWRNIVVIPEKLLNQYPLGLPIVEQVSEVLPQAILQEKPSPESESISLTSKSALVLSSNGKVLFSKNANEQLPLASLTKMVALKVFLDTNPNLNKVVEYKVADENYNYEWAPKSVLARLRVNDGESMTIRDLLYTSILGSANNTVESLVRVSGLSRKDFIAKMNSYVKDLGATHTKFIEPTGLSPQNVSTVSDYGIISQAVLKDGHLEKVSMTKNYSFTTINTKKYHFIKNSNSLFFTSNLNITASKTGYLDEAKYCLMTRVKDKAGKEVIAITFGTPDRATSFKETETLLNYGLKYGI